MWICLIRNILPTGDNLIGALSQHLIDIVIFIVIVKAINDNPGNQDSKT
jgi:hypothetical protein